MMVLVLVNWWGQWCWMAVGSSSFHGGVGGSDCGGVVTVMIRQRP